MRLLNGAVRTRRACGVRRRSTNRANIMYSRIYLPKEEEEKKYCKLFYEIPRIHSGFTKRHTAHHSAQPYHSNARVHLSCA